MIKTISTIGGWTMMSRLLGMVREILMSHFLGAGIIADAFVVAFKFPNFFRRFFAEGAFNAAFVPVFTSDLTAHGQKDARLLASNVMSFMFLFLSALCAVVVIAAPYIVYILAPGFATTPERLSIAVDFTRITFPYLLFISLTALMGGVLNSMGKFAAAAAAPVILNVVMISSLLIAHYIKLPVGYSLCTGVLIAGVMQWGFLHTQSTKHGMKLIFKWPELTPKVRRILKLMGPGTISAGVMQVNIFIDLVLASFLPTGALSYLYYADRLNQLPLSIFGIAISTALLPLLSKHIRLKQYEDARLCTDQALRTAMQLTLPSTIGLVLLANPIIQLIYGHGKFDTTAMAATSPTLAAFALGLPAYVMGKVFSTCFFAHQDTKTPLKIACASVFVNLLSNILLMIPLQHIGLALSTGIAAWVNAILLCALMHKRSWYSMHTRCMMIFLAKVAGACACMGAVIKCMMFLMPMPVGVTQEVLHIGAYLSVALITYGAASYALKLESILKGLKRQS